jgi:hypothetical protein
MVELVPSSLLRWEENPRLSDLHHRLSRGAPRSFRIDVTPIAWHGRDDAGPFDHGLAVRRLHGRLPRPRHYVADACRHVGRSALVTFTPCFLWIFLGAPFIVCAATRCHLDSGTEPDE